MPVGVEDGRIPDGALTASSYYSENYHPSRASFNSLSSKYCWAAKKNDANQWLQVCFHLSRSIIIGHFQVSKTLTFKMRLGVQPFLWKWVLLPWEWKMISIPKAERLSSFWNRGPGELENGLLEGWHLLPRIPFLEGPDHYQFCFCLHTRSRF